MYFLDTISFTIPAIPKVNYHYSAHSINEEKKKQSFSRVAQDQTAINSWSSDSNPGGTLETKEILKMLSVWPRYDTSISWKWTNATK